MATSAVELAKRAVRPDPAEGLPALTALRAHLDTLETWHVENAVRAGWSWRRIAEALGVTKQAAHRKHARRVRSRLPDRLTVRAEARRAVAHARSEASALGHPSVASSHLLLGLLDVREAVAAEALGALGITVEAARERVERDAAAPRRGARTRPAISARARSVLEQSLREAVLRGDRHLGVEHLLLALLRERNGGARRVLAALDVKAADVGRALDEVLGRAE